MLNYVRTSKCGTLLDGTDAINCVLSATDRFSLDNKRKALVGDDKRTVLDAEMRRQVNVTLQRLAEDGDSRPFVALELGTDVGYSTTRLARLMPEGSILYTVELRQRTQNVAKQYVSLTRAHLKPRVEFLLDSAADAIDSLGQQGVVVDFVFMDHSEKDYFNAFQHLAHSGVLRQGSMLISDNIGVNKDLEQVQRLLTQLRRPPWASYSIEHMTSEHTAEESAMPDSMEVSIFADLEIRHGPGAATENASKPLEPDLVKHLRQKGCSAHAQSLRCIVQQTEVFADRHPQLQQLGGEQGAVVETLMMQQAAVRRPGEDFVTVELGTGVGYSTIRLASQMPRGSTLYTVDRDQGKQGVAKTLLSMAPPLPAEVQFLTGTATEQIVELGRRGVKADVIFLDHDVGDYYAALLSLETSGLLKHGALVLAARVQGALNSDDLGKAALNYISRTRGSGLYSSYSVEWAPANVTFDEMRAINSLEVSTRIAEKSCAATGASCLKNRCCADPMTHCFEKDETWAQCLHSCETEEFGGLWTCRPLPHDIPPAAKETAMELLPGK